MNSTAQKHLAKAKDYLAKGDEFYRKAKPEIEAAKAEGARVQDMCRYLQKSERWVYDVLAWDGEGTLYANNTEARQLRQAKQVLRESSPEEIASDLLGDADVRRKVAKATEQAYDGVETKRVAHSRAAEREHIGDEAQDALDQEQQLREAEAALFRGRRGLRDMLVILREHGEEMRDSWREEFLSTLDSLEADIGMARALLAGSIDDDALAEFLSKEV
jgi:hypothetical protein